MMLVNNTCIVNLDRKCRICAGDLLDITCAIPIFSSICLDAKIQRYLYVKISPTDELPKVICATCFIKIESIDKFAFLAAKTEETYYTWLKRAKDLNALKAAAEKNAVRTQKDENQVDNKQGNQVQVQLLTQLPLSPQTSTQLQHQPSQKIILNTYRNPRNPRHVDHITLEQIINDQIVRNPKVLTKPDEIPKQPTSLSSTLAFHELKIGQLIKDEELLKLMLKALRWVETGNKRYTHKYWVKKLKGSKFKDVLSNPNLLKDSDLMQLIKSYVGQDALTLFSNLPPLPPVTVPYVTPPPHLTITSKPVSLIKTPPIRNLNKPQVHAVQSEPDFKISDEVTQMEVGVDPSLFLGDDEDSTNGTSRDKSTPTSIDNQDSAMTGSTSTTTTASEGLFNGVKLKTVPTKKTDVYSNSKLTCSMCSLSFSVSTDLQKHVLTHLLRNPEDKNKRPEVEIHFKRQETLFEDKKKSGKRRRKQEVTTPNAATLSLPEIELIPIPSIKKRKTTNSPSIEKSGKSKPVEEKSPTPQTTLTKLATSRKSNRKQTNDAGSAIEKVVSSGNLTPTERSTTTETVSSNKIISKENKTTNPKPNDKPVEKILKEKPKERPKGKKSPVKMIFKITRSPIRSRSALKLSRSSHRKDAKPTCSKCLKTFKTSAEQLKHQKNCPHSAKLACESCKKVFSSKSTLSVHLLSHAIQKKHKCSTCRKSFKTAKDLKIHSATHTSNELRKHLCPYCEKAYLTSSHLTTHKKRIHASQLEKKISPSPKVVKRVKFSDDTKG